MNHSLMRMWTLRKCQTRFLKITPVHVLPGQSPDRCLTSDQSGEQGDADIANQTGVVELGDKFLNSSPTASDRRCLLR